MTPAIEKSFRAIHHFAIDEDEPRRRFSSALCAAHTAYHWKATFTDEQTGEKYDEWDVRHLADTLARSVH